MDSFVNEVPAAAPSTVLRYYGEKLRLETDCWAVNEGLKTTEPDFVVIDVRGADEFALGHVPNAINIPHNAIADAKFPRSPKGTTFVVYGAGPHCNRADRAAMQLAYLELPVKTMIGGFSGWREEGFAVATAVHAA